MQNLPKESNFVESGELIPHNFEDYLLQINDVVDITIKTTSPELNEIFNINDNLNQMRMMGGGGMMTGGDIFYLNGYALDDKGFVEIPLIGEICLVGITTKEAKDKIEEKMKQYISKENYFVRVRLGGIRYSALGEFNRPGKFTILQNRVTIFEAIANAGEMSTIANKKEVHLIRQYPEGSRTHKINLNNSKLMASEFYFLRPNDMIYAEPMRVRELGTGTTFLQTFQLVLTTLTAALLVWNAVN
jgi:polysaccharide biosynthesis/export protein